MVLKGFAFVQFEKEAEARAAIEKEHGKEFLGNRIDVKQAKQGGGGGGPPPGPPPGPPLC